MAKVEVTPMLPKPWVVALDNPHGTDWRPVATGIVYPDRDSYKSDYVSSYDAGFRVWVTYQSAEGWRADYLYREQETTFTYFPHLSNCPPRTYARGWTLGAN